MAKPLVAIVGRPNVGKSTLFNRLIGQMHAIVHDTAGTTRDRLFADVSWGNRDFVIVDTGGLENESEGILGEVQSQAHRAIKDADLVVFMVDVVQGVTPQDIDIAQGLRQLSKPIIVATNKADNTKRAMGSPEFFQMGLGDPISISAYHNKGIEDLLDTLVLKLPDSREIPVEYPPEMLKLAIVGRANVGKSLMLNTLLGTDRAIVSSVSGTTRDVTDTAMEFHGRPVLLIDTAGIRRRGRIESGVERYSVMRSLRGIDRADVVLLVLDASELVTAQDTHIAGYIMDAYTSVVVVVNKWDLGVSLGLDEENVRREVLRSLRFMAYVPVRFASALEDFGLSDVMTTVMNVYKERIQEVPNGELSTVIARAFADHPPAWEGRRLLRVSKVAQEATNPPTFALYVNHPYLVHWSYQRYLENKIRESFGFMGSHLKLVFKPRGGR